jgi:TolB-like protein/Tfp pilus assembly protein PilF
MSTDLVGRTISRYRVDGLLGVGGMGVVYRAEDTRLRRPVALKFISSPLANDPVALRQFEREARTASSLSHPNICTIYEIDNWEGQPFIAMELLSGRTLKEQLANGGVDSLAIVDLALQVASALHAAHEKDIVHRDVKPANIFLTDSGPAKLLDFGLAKRLPLAEIDAALSGGFTEVGRILGTANYMSPERLRGRDIDHRSDLFSLGVVLYEMVTGRHAFAGESVVEVIEAVLHREPPPVDDRAGAQPKALMQIITRLLQKEPADRYHSAAALTAALADLRQELTAGRAAMAVGASAWPATRASIAVLPFRNLDPDPDFDYFADGLAEELIVALTNIEGLKVAARTSAFTFRGGAAELRDIGAKLKVETVLYGTIRRAGNHVRVACRLTSVADGFQIWSERYDRDMSDTAEIFALQDEITASIVARLKVAWVDRLQPMRRYTDDRESYLHYLKGRFYWAKRYSGGLMTAMKEFQAAIDRDPQNALAYSGQADVFAFLGLYSLMPPRDAFARAAGAAATAHAIDERLPEVHTSLGLIALSTWNWSVAEKEFMRATELDKEQALAHMYYAWLLALRNRPHDARLAIDCAQRADLLAPLVNSGAGWMFFLMREYERAIDECKKTAEREPDFLVGLYVMAMAHMRLGDYDEALALILRATELSNRAPFYLGLLGQVYAETGQRAAVDGIIAELDARRAANAYVPPHCYVYIYASLGDKDRAFAWQDRACDDGAPPFYFMSPAIESLHDDPRHHAHLARMDAEGADAARDVGVGTPRR